MRSQTVMIGVLMLFIGLIVGSVGTAMVLSSQAEESTATTGSAEADSAEADSAAANGESQAANNAAGGNAEQQAMMEQFIADTRHFKGDPDAPVTIIEFSDFRCPYCSKFAVEAGAQIDETYVEAGTVRFGYRHAAYQGEPAIRAAEASECAADQDAFWPYHDRLVEHVAVEGQRDFTVENLNRFAEELDLDTAAFAECLESGKYNELVLSETQSGQNLVRGTPMFLINGQMVSGAQPFETFQQVIERALGNEPPAADAAAPTAADQNGNVPDMEQLIADTRHFKGDPDAPVTIIEFSDFRCPYCSKFAVEAGAQIDETYVEAGTVRFGYRHAAYQGEPAIRAAEASECAADQDAFWPYHDRLVEHVAVEGQRDFTVENLNRFAEELDLDTAAFAECLESGKYNELVLSETQSGRSFVRGTPMFLVNGQMVSGAQPFETFQRVIDAQLNN